MNRRTALMALASMAFSQYAAAASPIEACFAQVNEALEIAAKNLATAEKNRANVYAALEAAKKWQSNAEIYKELYCNTEEGKVACTKAALKEGK